MSTPNNTSNTSNVVAFPLPRSIQLLTPEIAYKSQHNPNLVILLCSATSQSRFPTHYMRYADYISSAHIARLGLVETSWEQPK